MMSSAGEGEKRKDKTPPNENKRRAEENARNKETKRKVQEKNNKINPRDRQRLERVWKRLAIECVASVLRDKESSAVRSARPKGRPTRKWVALAK